MNPASFVAALAAAFFLVPGVGHAQEKATAQQERMKTCNAQAATQALKGDERKQFMSACLKAEDASAGAGQASGPQERMRSCNAQASAKDLKGGERKTFMSRCLKS
jgi:hypothetical protein